MGPGSSTEPAGYAPAERRQLLDLARRSIEHGLRAARFAPAHADYPARLRERRASFVTLHLEGALRGCIGTLEARAPLIEDVADNARAAAFGDPRFPALTVVEFERIELHISVLGVPEPLACVSETDLLARLRPGVDGLILEEGGRRGTFLPSVWDQLPERGEFLRQLKRKAGLPADYWSRTLRVSRYTAESIG